MSINIFSPVRRLFDLNISSAELKKIDTMNLAKVSNSTINLLERTLVTSGNADKRQKIQNLMEKISAVKNEYTVASQQKQIKQDISVLNNLRVVNFMLQKQEGANTSKTSEVVTNSMIKTNSTELTAKERALKNLQVLGLEIDSFPKTYGDLLSAIKLSFDEDFSNKFGEKFRKLDLDRKMTPKLTEKIMHNLLMSSTCLANLAEHFDGVLNVSFSQTNEILSNVQIGKDGLCSALSFKWCADKNQGIEFFGDVKTPEGLDEVISIKTSGGQGLVNYFVDRNLKLFNSKSDLNFENNSINVIQMKSSSDTSEPGHAVASYINTDMQLYNYFDSNFGEFSFSSSDKMKDFFDLFTEIGYKDLDNKKQIVFSI